MQRFIPAVFGPGNIRPARAPIDWVGVLFGILLTIVVVVPLVVVGVWAFTEVWRYPNVVPQQFGLRFWDQTLTRPDVWAALTLSLQLSTVVTLLSAAICLPAAYAFARMSFPGRTVLFFSFLAGHAFPKFGLLIAIAAIFLQLNLIGTFWGVVLIQLVGTLLFMIWMWAPARFGSFGPSPCRRPGRPLPQRSFSALSAPSTKPKAPG
jgi:putative spermidine/putrescine transport system permease protein